MKTLSLLSVLLFTTSVHSVVYSRESKMALGASFATLILQIAFVTTTGVTYTEVSDAQIEQTNETLTQKIFVQRARDASLGMLIIGSILGCSTDLFLFWCIPPEMNHDDPLLLLIWSHAFSAVILAFETITTAAGVITPLTNVAHLNDYLDQALHLSYASFTLAAVPLLTYFGVLLYWLGWRNPVDGVVMPPSGTGYPSRLPNALPASGS